MCLSQRVCVFLRSCGSRVDLILSAELCCKRKKRFPVDLKKWCAWYKAHLAVDNKTQVTIHGSLTEADTQDCQNFNQLIHKIDELFVFAVGDGVSIEVIAARDQAVKIKI